MQEPEDKVVTLPISSFPPITLEEMKTVRLMNRTDTKYTTDIDTLHSILAQAQDKYYIQETGGERLLPYKTSYLDTSYYKMYTEHERGKKTRQKIRIRTYIQSGISFLEIKNKNNKSRTKKIRIPYNRETYKEFIESHTPYRADQLSTVLDNKFTRITLVNRNKTERITIDLDLHLHNRQTGITCHLPDLAIIEVKRDGNKPSDILTLLRDARVKQSKFSKYCIGMALTDSNLRQNRFKQRLRQLAKTCTILLYNDTTKIDQQNRTTK